MAKIIYASKEHVSTLKKKQKNDSYHNKRGYIIYKILFYVILIGHILTT